MGFSHFLFYLVLDGANGSGETPGERWGWLTMTFGNPVIIYTSIYRHPGGVKLTHINHPSALSRFNLVARWLPGELLQAAHQGDAGKVVLRTSHDTR